MSGADDGGSKGETMVGYQVVAGNVGGQWFATKTEAISVAEKTWADAVNRYEDEDAEEFSEISTDAETVWERTEYSPGQLYSYREGNHMGPATEDEVRASRRAALVDGGRGIILIDGVTCYAEEG